MKSSILSLACCLLAFTSGCKRHDLVDCDALSTALDLNIGNPITLDGMLTLTEDSHIVGGILENIWCIGGDPNAGANFCFSFSGISKKLGIIVSTSNVEIPYEIGKFYQFDLEDTYRYSSALSGVFLDNDFTKFTVVDCNTSTQCQQLKDALESSAFYSEAVFEDEIIGFEDEVGGTLVSSDFLYLTNSLWLLKFQGKEKTGRLFLMSTGGMMEMNYEMGKFYSFKLSDRSSSGLLMDEKGDKLSPGTCK